MSTCRPLLERVNHWLLLTPCLADIALNTWNLLFHAGRVSEWVNWILNGDDEDDGAVVDMNNLDTTIQVSPILTTRIHKDHPLYQVIGDFQSATQTRNMSKNLEEHGFDPSWIEAMQEELLQFKNKKDESIRNKARLVAQGYTQEEEIDYDEVFAPVQRIKANKRSFLAYASFKEFYVYQMDGRSDFLLWEDKERVYDVNHHILTSRLSLIRIQGINKHFMEYIKRPRAGMNPCQHTVRHQV
ncbi:putative ribonuclease H-like domain-containing protein [Tanacetum coccineum]